MNEEFNNFNIEEELRKLPDSPGVYIMHEKTGKVIYVGKAVNLKNRVRSYFKSSHSSERTNRLVENISFFEYIITSNEIEALMLECNLIKKYNPKYNVLLKDDKAYPYICVSVKDSFPRVSLARKNSHDGNKYYGPYFSSWVVNTTIDAVKNIFPLRNCNRKIEVTKDGNTVLPPLTRPCLNYQIGICTAPCAGYTDKRQYDIIVSGLCDFLSGDISKVENNMKKEMTDAADRLDFERAAVLRDRITALQALKEKQKATLISKDDFDAVAVCSGDVDACLQILFVRGGKITGRDYFIFEGAALCPCGEIISSFVKQFYNENAVIPSFVCCEDLETDDDAVLSQYLSGISGKKCTVYVPERGEKKSVVLMAKKNAEVSLDNYSRRSFRENGENLKAVEKLASVLELPKVPMRIEAYDISNMGSSEINASMVVFYAGAPLKKEYKLFKLKTVEIQNDFASMEEIITRRFERYINKSEGFNVMPDLLLIDGGYGQLKSVRTAIDRLNSRGEKIDAVIVGMTKDNKHRSYALCDENGREYLLKNDTDVWRFITQIQNEAHRFAISYNRKLTQKRQRVSALDLIPGIGEKKKIALLKHFGSVDKIKKASVEELSEAEGIGRKYAASIYDYFRKTERQK